MVLLELWPQGVNSLAKDLEVVENPDLDQFVTIEFFPAAAPVLLDAVDRLQDVEDSLGCLSRRYRFA